MTLPNKDPESFASYLDPDTDEKGDEGEEGFYSDTDSLVSSDDEEVSDMMRDIINIYMVYYKNLFQKEVDLTMFDGIDYSKSNSTSRPMELFYDHVCRYKEKEHDELNASIYVDKEDTKEWPSLYILTLEGEEDKFCQLLVPLLSYLATKDWANSKWAIIPMKTEDE